MKTHSHLYSPAIRSAKALFIVERYRSCVGLPSKYKDAFKFLRLTKTHHARLIVPSPEVVGTLALVKNLVKINYVDRGPFPLPALQAWMKGRGKRADLGYYIESRGPFHSG